MHLSRENETKIVKITNSECVDSKIDIFKVRSSQHQYYIILPLSFMVKEEELKEEVGYDYYDFKVSSDKNCKFCG